MENKTTRKLGTTVANEVHKVLLSSTQPLSVLEIAKAASIALGREMSPAYARLCLRELEASGFISSRVETDKEHLVRSNFKDVRSINARLFWAPGENVPERTVTEAVPGVVLSSAPGRKRGAAKSPKAKTKTKTKPVGRSAITTNDAIDYLIEKLVDERVKDLQSKLDEVETKFATLQRMIYSAMEE